MTLLQIVSGFFQHGSIIFGVPKNKVAMATKKASNLPCRMVVVNTQTLALTANIALVLACFTFYRVVFGGNTICANQVVIPSVGAYFLSISPIVALLTFLILFWVLCTPTLASGYFALMALGAIPIQTTAFLRAMRRWLKTTISKFCAAMCAGSFSFCQHTNTLTYASQTCQGVF